MWWVCNGRAVGVQGTECVRCVVGVCVVRVCVVGVQWASNECAVSVQGTECVY